MTESNPPPSEPSPFGTPPAEGAAPPPPAAGAPVVGYEAKGAPYSGPTPTADDRTMALLAHLLGIVLGFIGPLIIWLVKKDQSPFVEDQSKEALNFQITLLIAYAIGGVTTMVCVGFIILPAVWLASLILSILAGVAANKGEAYRYPLTIRLIT